MGILSQRLILMFVFINLLIGIVTTIYQEPTSTGGILFAKSSIKSNIDNYDSSSSNAMNDESLYSGINNDNLITDTTVGNPLTMGVFIVKIFWNSINPFPMDKLDSSELTDVESLFNIFLSIIRITFLILAGYELYVVIKNKKGT